MVACLAGSLTVVLTAPLGLLCLPCLLLLLLSSPCLRLLLSLAFPRCCSSPLLFFMQLRQGLVFLALVPPMDDLDNLFM